MATSGFNGTVYRYALPPDRPAPPAGLYQLLLLSSAAVGQRVVLELEDGGWGLTGAGVGVGGSGGELRRVHGWLWVWGYMTARCAQDGASDSASNTGPKPSPSTQTQT